MGMINYESNPWSGLDNNKRDWYDPFLIDYWQRNSVYSLFSTIQFAMGNAPNMIVTESIAPHVNFDPIGQRQLWMDSTRSDSRSVNITFSRYGSKVQIHRYDEILNYWVTQNGGGLRELLNRNLGYTISEVTETVPRNTFFAGSLLQTGYHMIGNQANKLKNADGTINYGFNSLTASDTMTTELLEAVMLGLNDREAPFTRSLEPGITGSVFCITSQNVIHSLTNETDSTQNNVAMNQFIPVNLYDSSVRRAYGEVGMYKGVRFLVTPRAVLRNLGTKDIRAKIISPVKQGDGAPGSETLVDGVYNVGQPSAAKYIVVDDASNFELNMRVTIHTRLTSEFGVIDGADFRDGTSMVRRVVAVDTNANTISFDEPILIDMDTNLEPPSAVYGYITYGRDVHTATFIGGNNGLGLGVLEPPRLTAPAPFDDFDEMYRQSWHARMGWQVLNPHAFEVAFLSAPSRWTGPIIR